MDFSSSLYLTEVLGIKNYLCPKNTFSIRHIEGAWPCELLAVVCQPINPSEKDLLKKITHSIGFSSFTLLEIKNPSYLESFIETSKTQNIAKHIILFASEPTDGKQKVIKGNKQAIKNARWQVGIKTANLQPTQNNFLQTYTLAEMTGSSPTINQKKKQLWGQLKQWN